MNRRVLEYLEGPGARITVRGFLHPMDGTIVAASDSVLVFDEDGAPDRLVLPWRSIIAVSLRGVR